MPLQEDPVSRGEPLYECPDCGDRAEDPDGRVCDCGSYLRNIGVPRPQ